MKISERTKGILFSGLTVLAPNLLFQREWEPVLLGVGVFVVGALIFPYLITFMSDANELNRRD